MIHGPIRAGHITRIGLQLGIVLVLIILLKALFNEGDHERLQKMDKISKLSLKSRVTSHSVRETTFSSTRAPPLCLPEGKHDQEDPCLVHFALDHILQPPSNLSRRLTWRSFPIDPERQVGTQQKIDFLKEYFISPNSSSSSPGFFVECGAYNGESLSQTLKLEMEYNWTGLLIEANHREFLKIMRIRRNVWTANVALCPTKHSDRVIYFTGRGHVLESGLRRRISGGDGHLIDCVPLYTLLKALNRSSVDYLSLDVEGVELHVLKTVPYDKLVFKVIAVEHAHVTGFQKAVVDFLEGKGYRFIGTLLDFYTQDSLFVHESVYKEGMSLKRKLEETEASSSEFNYNYDFMSTNNYDYVITPFNNVIV